MSQEVQVRVPVSEAPVARRSSRYRAVSVIGLLLLVQAGVLLAIGVYNLWELGATPSLDAFLRRLSAFLGAILALLAPLTLTAAIACLAARRNAWSLAILTQGLGLLAALVLYLREGPAPAYVYGVMVYHIILVLYLNSWDVQASFRARTARTADAAPVKDRVGD